MQPCGIYSVSLAVKPILAGIVTLNLVQGPSGRKRSASRKGDQSAVQRANARFVWGAKWTLNQVQGDKVGQEAKSWLM